MTSACTRAKVRSEPDDFAASPGSDLACDLDATKGFGALRIGVSRGG